MVMYLSYMLLDNRNLNQNILFNFKMQFRSFITNTLSRSKVYTLDSLYNIRTVFATVQVL